MTTVAFIGLGVMGYPMAGHLSRAGCVLKVYNRSREKAIKWCDDFAGEIAATPAEAASEADFVIACVGRDEDVQQITTDKDGAFHTMRQGTVFIDHTTTSAQLAETLCHTANAKGLYFLDAPVSGGEAGAQQGILSIMVGGEKSIFKKAEPLLHHYGRQVVLIGKTGSGQRAKMVNQICIAGLIQALAEGLSFGEKSGLDMDKVLSVISQGAAQSWQMENRATTMLEDKFDFGFAVDWMHKDLGICLETAKKMQTNLPVTQLVEQYYAKLQQQGGGRWDTSSLIRLLSKKV